MDYQPKHFNLPANQTVEADEAEGIQPYVFSENITIAVDVALATGRPLLVAGKPGCGKSRLAEAMAALQGWNYLSHTLTSRTRLEELTAEQDHLQRLNDAHVEAHQEKVKHDWVYQKPGIFWWAYHADSAKNRGGKPAEAEQHEVTLNYPESGIEREQDDGNSHTVLLLDEIDKAEPDLPNDLLEPLDRRSFSLINGGQVKAKPDQQILTIITTNRERELPPAFLRRCVTLTIEEPDTEKLIHIGEHHFPDAEAELLQALAERIEALKKEASQHSRRPPGTSEYLDAIHACQKLGLAVDSEQWNTIWPKIEQAVLIKDIRP